MSGITHTVAINIVHHVLIFRLYVYVQVNKVESEYFSRYEKENCNLPLPPMSQDVT